MGGVVDADELIKLKTIAMTVREEVLQFWHDRSCIASTRVALNVLEYFGYKGKPVALSIAAFNSAGWKLVTADPQISTSEWPPEAWSVGVAGTGKFDPVNDDWDGHLVALIDSRNEKDTQLIVDTSLDQLSRPQRGIELEANVFPVPRPWGGVEMVYTSTDPDLVLTFKVSNTPGQWRTARDWTQRRNLVRQVTASSIKRLRAEGL
jgi:hypothetical protein